jgi:NAD(P)-dependent dehydrogenase (short-subunit alcohol dehydrogenase family)
VAFVTGAANGIGRAAALAFAREGASVLIADVSQQGTGRRLDRRSWRAGTRGQVRRVRAEDIKAALDKAVQAFGRLDFAFNNAGVEQPRKAAADLTEEDWNRIIDIDLVECSYACGRRFPCC